MFHPCHVRVVDLAVFTAAAKRLLAKTH